MISAIGFDLWETLISMPPDRLQKQETLARTRLGKIMRHHGFAKSSDQIREAYAVSWRRCRELYWSKFRDVPCRQQIHHLLEALDIEPAACADGMLGAIEDAYTSAAVDVLPEVVDGARQVLATLKARNYRLGLICNTGRAPGSTLREVLARLDLAQFLTVMVFSDEHGACKPATLIFESFRRALGLAAAETVFVGDNLYVDIQGAQRCGIFAVHFIPQTRGCMVAPPSPYHGLNIVPDATIRDIRELIGVIDDLPRQPFRSGKKNSRMQSKTA